MLLLLLLLLHPMQRRRTDRRNERKKRRGGRKEGWPALVSLSFPIPSSFFKSLPPPPPPPCAHYHHRRRRRRHQEKGQTAAAPGGKGLSLCNVRVRRRKGVLSARRSDVESRSIVGTLTLFFPLWALFSSFPHMDQEGLGTSRLLSLSLFLSASAAESVVEISEEEGEREKRSRLLLLLRPFRPSLRPPPPSSSSLSPRELELRPTHACGRVSGSRKKKTARNFEESFLRTTESVCFASFVSRFPTTEDCGDGPPDREETTVKREFLHSPSQATTFLPFFKKGAWSVLTFRSWRGKEFRQTLLSPLY